jgi:hypothetical protein
VARYSSSPFRSSEANAEVASVSESPADSASGSSALAVEPDPALARDVPLPGSLARSASVVPVDAPGPEVVVADDTTMLPTRISFENTEKLFASNARIARY